TPLDETESRRMIVRCLGGDVEPSLLETMLLKSGGNAFFIEQLAHSLRETGAIGQEGGVWVGRRSLALVVPDSVHEVLGARIDSLGAGPGRVLRAAAVVGRTFWERVLERNMPNASTPSTRRWRTFGPRWNTALAIRRRSWVRAKASRMFTALPATTRRRPPATGRRSRLWTGRMTGGARASCASWGSSSRSR